MKLSRVEVVQIYEEPTPLQVEEKWKNVVRKRRNKVKRGRVQHILSQLFSVGYLEYIFSLRSYRYVAVLARFLPNKQTG